MKLGNIATGADFYNRSADLREIWTILAADHITLNGPRRLGKSSVLHKLLAQAANNGYDSPAVIVDVQGCASIEAFIDRMLTAFPDLKKRPRSLNPFKSVKALGLGFEIKEHKQPGWQQLGDTMMEQLVVKKQLILIDEFSVFIEALLQREPLQGAEFLGWLRRWRLVERQQWRLVFTGSIGLHALLEQHGLETTMNDCYDYPLKPFKTKHAIAMAQHFAIEKQWSLAESEAQLLCDKIGWLSPYFVNLLLHESVSSANERLTDASEPHQAIEAQDINAGYERLLASRSKFSHWLSRLNKRLPVEEAKFCMTMLTYICQADGGLNLSQLMSRLQRLEPDSERREQLVKKLRILLNDEGYLSVPDSDGKVQFLSFLLKDYWKRNHG